MYRDMIGRQFFAGRDPGEIKTITETGDRHVRGEAVSKIETLAGLTLFYKPRDCRSTLLLGDITVLLFGVRMTPEQITGEGFAFQKAVEKADAADMDMDAYAERLGQLTAVFYMLGSTDMHNGNVIPSKMGPVVIDTETVLSAGAEGVGGAGEFSVDYGAVFPELLTSVGECMVLPRFFGLMQTSPLYPFGAEPEAERIGGDAFIAGFTNGYHRILEKREEILRILDRYSEVPFRYLLRSTQSYAAKLRKLEKAKSETETEEVFRSLEKGLSEADIRRWAPVLRWEKECLQKGEIPYFCLVAGEKALYGDPSRDALIPEYLSESPIAFAKRRMNRMNEADLAVQTAYIRAGLRHVDYWKTESDRSKQADACKEASERKKQEKHCGTEFIQHDDSEEKRDSACVLTSEEAIHEVTETIRLLWEERIPLADGCLLWHTPMIRGRVGSLFGLAEGFAGTAVFLRACATSDRITGEPAELAKKMANGAFRALAAFGEYLINTYSAADTGTYASGSEESSQVSAATPLEERVISRQFNGGFDFRDGLSGYLWALRYCRDEDPERAGRILESPLFHTEELHYEERRMQDAWDKLLREAEENAAKTAQYANEETLPLIMTDCLESGNAGYAARLLSENKTEEAGVLLKKMLDRKKREGNYRVFHPMRHQYFLPAFLRGTTGISYIYLLYIDHHLSH